MRGPHVVKAIVHITLLNKSIHAVTLFEQLDFKKNNNYTILEKLLGLWCHLWHAAKKGLRLTK